MNRCFYAIAHAILRAFFAIVYPIRVIGVQNVPMDGPVILCGNHLSFLDPPCVAASIQRPVFFIAKHELFEHKWLRPIISGLGAFSVTRGAMDLKAMRRALGVLKEGSILGIFPQGTRDLKGEHRMETGVALIAQRSQAPLVPIHIFGPYKPFRKTRVVFGRPLDLSAFQGKFDSETLAQVTQFIERSIWSLDAAE